MSVVGASRRLVRRYLSEETRHRIYGLREKIGVAVISKKDIWRYNRNQPVFDIMPEALPAPSITDLYTRMIDEDPPMQTGQSGSVLAGTYHLESLLEPLRQRISDRFACKMYLRLDKSSYRRQPPDGRGALPLHQDYIALRELRTVPYIGHYHSDPLREPCCTVWMPLNDIDEKTPTLQVCPRLPSGYIEHKSDAAGYAVLADSAEYEGWPLYTISQLPAGWGVVFGPLTLHRSYARPWHTATRRSFDLRFFPTPNPASRRQRLTDVSGPIRSLGM